MNTTTVRCRAIIVDNNEMLTVKHVGNEFVALPGGHLEPGESPVECVTREIIEELGMLAGCFILIHIWTKLNHILSSFSLLLQMQVSSEISSLKIVATLTNGKSYIGFPKTALLNYYHKSFKLTLIQAKYQTHRNLLLTKVII